MTSETANLFCLRCYIHLRKQTPKIKVTVVWKSCYWRGKKLCYLCLGMLFRESHQLDKYIPDQQFCLYHCSFEDNKFSYGLIKSICGVRKYLIILGSIDYQNNRKVKANFQLFSPYPVTNSTWSRQVQETSERLF